MKTTDRIFLRQSDFIGFDWIIDIHGALERLLDRIDTHEQRARSISAIQAGQR